LVEIRNILSAKPDVELIVTIALRKKVPLMSDISKMVRATMLDSRIDRKPAMGFRLAP